ncbi:MAG TPA: hypothetical protein VN376_01895 [Longilinea sp.]|nr:hypothetical protein [Longilinea sp.]
MSRLDKAALLLSLITILTSYLVADRIFDRIPHLEDEMAYVWQSETIPNGEILVPSPPCTGCFLVPFVIDHNGFRFGKYPLGWPVVLSIAYVLNGRDWVNPIIAGLCIWFLYRIIQKITKNDWTAILGAFLTASSPFFLLNSGSLLSHPWSLLLTLVFTCAWLDLYLNNTTLPRPLLTLTAAFTLGALILTRPFTAAAIAIPFFIHGAILFLKRKSTFRWELFGIGIFAVFCVGLYLLWQYHVTGSPLTNPYTLWWSYDTIGFGPGHGRQEGGYMPDDIWMATKPGLESLLDDTYGWENLSWVFLPFGLIALWKNRQAWLVSSILPMLILAYLLYWINAQLFGPRYYYEGIESFSLLSAAGITWLVGEIPKTGFKFIETERWLRPLIVLIGLSALVGWNLISYLPERLQGMYGLYGANETRLSIFTNPATAPETPAVVIVHIHESWIEYGALLDLSTPYLDTPYVITLNMGEDNNQIVNDAFPDRYIYEYDPSGDFYHFILVREPISNTAQ